jgi:hypothetical protein
MRGSPFFSCTLFAEDIRQELGGQVSLIGILPDNLALPQLPALMSKMAIYTRATFPSSEDIQGDLTHVLVSPSGERLAENVTTRDHLGETLLGSRNQGAPIMTMVSQIVATPFPINEAGRFLLLSQYGEEEYLSGFLNVALEADVHTRLPE